MPVTMCSLCESPKLVRIVDLGFHPLADSFLKKEELMQPETTYPLEVLMCSVCGHAMSSYVVPPSTRYQDHDYSYDSSNSKISVEHFGEMAGNIIELVGVSKNDLVVDIGSSVGTLLQAFKDKAGTRILGVEPAHNIAALADKNNIPTVHDFWNNAAAQQVLALGKAKVVTITNAFNHVNDLDSFMRNIVATLSPDGVCVIEVPYLLPLVKSLAFDTIYLEHVSYFAIKPLVGYFKKFGMCIADVMENDYMGGTMRIFVRFGDASGPSVAEYIVREEAARLFDTATYEAMATRIKEFRYDLLTLLLKIKKQGGHIIGVGAPAKGNTLLNYCGIDTEFLNFITDASALKIGKYTPGTHISILSDDAITEDITHALILPWNIGDFLKARLSPRYPRISFIVPHMK